MLETYAPTCCQLAQQLISFPHISGVRPTTLMNQLLSLLPDGNNPETMFLLLFLDCQLLIISSQLTACTFRHPRDMVAYANQIWDSMPLPAQPVAALPPQPCSVSPVSTVSCGQYLAPAAAKPAPLAFTAGQLLRNRPPPMDYIHCFHRWPPPLPHR